MGTHKKRGWVKYLLSQEMMTQNNVFVFKNDFLINTISLHCEN